MHRSIARRSGPARSRGSHAGRNAHRRQPLSIERYESRLAMSASGMIETLDEFKVAFERHEVREVSPALVGLFPASPPTLYKLGIYKAWIGSSDNLYSLLQLNQRYPSPAPSSGHQLKANPEVLDGLARIVGFPFPHPANSGDRATNAGNPISVFELKDFVPTDLGADTTPVVPTFDGFFAYVNSRFALSGKPELPQAVLTRLNWYYRGVADGSRTPLDAYRSLSGLTADQLVDESFVGYDVVTNPPQRSAITNPSQFELYKKANTTIGPYYLSPQAPSPYSTDVAIINFIQFAQDYPPTSPAAIDQLAVGFRVLLAMSFDASPLFTGLGVGYSDVPNPFCGLKNPQPPRWPATHGLPVYVGQEFQIPNGNVPAESLTISSDVATPPATPLYLRNDGPGFITLERTKAIHRGHRPVVTPADTSFQWSGSIRDAGVAVRFTPGSVSSDTITAAAIPVCAGSHPQTWLTGRSTVSDGGRPQKLSSLPGLAHSLLPKRFATYVSLAGGVDFVVGSRYADVIVGPSTAGLSSADAETFHGRLTVDSGAGDDVVEPGRGGSLVRLGPGRDTVVVGAGDLFGKTTLLDFKAASDRDRLVIDESLIVRGWGTNTLVIADGDGHEKMLFLAGTSDATWEPASVITRAAPAAPATAVQQAVFAAFDPGTGASADAPLTRGAFNGRARLPRR